MDLKIIPLSEGTFFVGQNKLFTPYNKNEIIQNEGKLLVEIQPFLLIDKKDYILLDTGLGLSLENGNLQIFDNLYKYNIAPHQITKVLISHLHKDHSGGIFYKNTEGELIHTFPNASYYINQKEIEYAIAKGAPSYQFPDFKLLLNSSQVVWLNEEGVIDNFIFYTQDGGHCPYHTSYLISTENEKYFFGGDVAPHSRQMKIAYKAKYDFDGEKSMQLRKIYLEKGKKENWKFLFYHDEKIPVGIM